MNHFVEDGYKQLPGEFLDDPTYAKILDQIVVSCADAILVRWINNQPEILLGKRAYPPMKGWWIFGGRRIPGESPEESCVRNIKREIGLDLEPSRFTLLKCYSYV